MPVLREVPKDSASRHLSSRVGSLGLRGEELALEVFVVVTLIQGGLLPVR